MNTKTMEADAFRRLVHLCTAMQIPADIALQGSAAAELTQAQHAAITMLEKLQLLTNQIPDILAALRCKAPNTVIDMLPPIADQVTEIFLGASAIYEHFTDMLVVLRGQHHPSTWLPLLADDEVKAALDAGFALTDDMTLGYNNGQFLLLFEKSDQDPTLVTAPVPVAVGQVTDADAVHNYLTQFLDLEIQEE